MPPWDRSLERRALIVHGEIVSNEIIKIWMRGRGNILFYFTYNSKKKIYKRHKYINLYKKAQYRAQELPARSSTSLLLGWAGDRAAWPAEHFSVSKGAQQLGDTLGANRHLQIIVLSHPPLVQVESPEIFCRPLLSSSGLSVLKFFAIPEAEPRLINI